VNIWRYINLDLIDLIDIAIKLMSTVVQYLCRSTVKWRRLPEEKFYLLVRNIFIFTRAVEQL